ncbi:MAG: hypothetical protein AAFQ43_11150 [Bacteroidota bacterium]
MIRLTRALGALLLALSITACSSSQDTATQDGPRARGGDPGQRVERQLESLREAVDLTDEQVVEIRALLEEQAANRPSRGARGQGNRQEMRAQRQAQRAEMMSQIEAILTPEQVEAFREWAASQQQRGRRGGPSGRRGNG